MNDKRISYKIYIALETDGDFSFHRELFKPCNSEWYEFKELGYDCYEIDIFDDYGKMWSSGDWCKCLTRSLVDDFISAINVSSTHLYIWRDLLEISDSISNWIWNKLDEKSNSWYMSGNYDGTEFTITRM